MDRLLTAVRAPVFVGIGLAAVYLFQTLPSVAYARPATMAVQPLILLTCAAAVICARRPVLAVLVASSSAACTAVVIRDYDIRLPVVVGPFTPAETVAFLVIIVTVVFTADAVVAIIEVGFLGASATFALFYQHAYGLFSSTFRLNLALDVAVVGVVVMVAVYLRAQAGMRRRALTTAVTDAQRAERVELARELHDVVAHHVTGMVVQAQAAMAVSENDPLAAHRLLPGIVNSGSDALTAMRRLVGTLRESESLYTATTDLEADVRAAVDRAAQAGVPVRLRMELPDPVPQEVGRSVLRMVQESLTNVHKHANAPTDVSVELTRTVSGLRLLVRDDGIGGRVVPVGGSGGYGLVGMRERVELLGGLFSAGEVDGGWQVLAELPLGESKQQGEAR